MTNPYTLLGISESASDDDVKKAYRARVVEYSSDNYKAEPNATIAAEKLEEFNAAYDEIMSRRRVGVSSSEQSNGSFSAKSGVYADICTLIKNGSLDSATQKLNEITEANRGAEWNFLMGCVSREKGWLEDAFRYACAATSMEPDNAEYSALYDALSSGRTSGSSYTPYGNSTASSQQTGTPYSNNPSSPCADGGDACSTLCQCLCLYSACQSCCCHGN